MSHGKELAKERVTGHCVGVSIHGRRVIRPHGAFETCLVIGAQHLRHVGRTVVMKPLDKVLAPPLHVAEVRPSETSEPVNARSASHLQGVDLRTVFIALDPHG